MWQSSSDYAAGNGRNHRRPFFCRFKFHVAAQAAVVQTVDAHIDNDRAGFDPPAFDKVRNAHADHQNIGGGNFIGKIFGRTVADRYRCARQQQFQRLRAVGNIRRADHDRFFPLRINAVSLQSVITPLGVHGRISGILTASLPTL